MTTHYHRGGTTLAQIRVITEQLKNNKTVLVVGLSSPDLYLRMITNEGVTAEAEKQNNGFIFKNVVNLKK